MMSEVITTSIGLFAGVLTGFYFEGRTTKATEAQNSELRRQLDILRAAVFSMGADPDTLVVDHQHVSNLRAEVEARARSTQDASGKVDRQKLVAYFVSSGSTSAATEAAISEICSAGIAREDGPWL